MLGRSGPQNQIRQLEQGATGSAAEIAAIERLKLIMGRDSNESFSRSQSLQTNFINSSMIESLKRKG